MPIFYYILLELSSLQFDGTWREAVAKAKTDTDCPLHVGNRGIDYSDGGYGVTVIGTNVTVKGSDRLWRNRYLEVRGHGSGAVVIPFVGESILFERHYRIATDEFSWELPRGFGEPNETDAETARRELREETGLLADDVTVISRIHADAGIMNDDIAVVATRSSSLDYLTPDHSWESMGFALVPANELDDFIAQANVNDAITLAALRILVTMSSGKLHAISNEKRHEDGPYGGMVYGKPTFDELDRLNHRLQDENNSGDITNDDCSSRVDDMDSRRFGGYDFDDGSFDSIMREFDAASRNLDDLSDALDDNASGDDYSFDVDDDTDFIVQPTIGDDSVYGRYKTLIDSDGDGRPDSIADFNYDGHGLPLHDDNLTEDDFAFDGDDSDIDEPNYSFDDENDNIGGETASDFDDIDDDEGNETYNALFGSQERYEEFDRKRHSEKHGTEQKHADSSTQSDDVNIAQVATSVNAHDEDNHEMPTDEEDSDEAFDDDDYLESDDDDVPADIAVDDAPMLDTDESDKLKNLIAEFSAEHAINGNQEPQDDDTIDNDDITNPTVSGNADNNDAYMNSGEKDEQSDETDREKNDIDIAPQNIEPEVVDNGSYEDDYDIDSDDEQDESDDDSDDNEYEGDDEDAHDGWSDPEQPHQPKPPIWATEVITTSSDKPQQIGDVMRYLTNGDRSKVGRLIVNFGRREFFIKPIDPDDRVTRLDSHNVGRICNGGLVDFDNDEYEQRLKDLLTTMKLEREQTATGVSESSNDETDDLAEENQSDDIAEQKSIDNEHDTDENDDDGTGVTINAETNEQQPKAGSNGDKKSEYGGKSNEQQNNGSNDINLIDAQETTDKDSDDFISDIDVDDAIDSILDEINDEDIDGINDLDELFNNNDDNDDKLDDEDDAQDFSIDDMF